MRLSARVDYALRATAEIAARAEEARAEEERLAKECAEEGALDPRPPALRTRPAGGRTDDAHRAVNSTGPTGTPRRPVPLTAEQIARAQHIPPKFLESILLQLRRSGIVHAQRGPEGGYWLAHPATEITLADVIRAIDGPLANVRGQRPEDLGYEGAARALQEVWIALRASEREILELVTIADVANGQLPSRVRELSADPEAWV